MERAAKIFIAVFLLAGFLFSSLSLAQEQNNNANGSLDQCQTKEECEALLKQYEDKISQYEKEIGTTQKEKRTLQNQIKIYQDKIKKLDLQIRQGNVMVSDLKQQISQTEVSIDQTAQKIEETKIQLKAGLRALERANQRSVAEAFLTGDDLSGFFNNLARLETINAKVGQGLNRVKAFKVDLANQKDSLDQKKQDLTHLIGVQTLQKQQSSENKKQQEQLLETTQGKEALYQQYLSETKKRATEIRAKLFALIGVSQAPTFGEALEVAKTAASLTRVRPAFLLAVISVESAIGRNVGQCYLVNTGTGAGIRILNNKIESKTMHPKRDVPYFLNITQILGRDSYKTPISCPVYINGAPYGWGGAMGPAQFIPSTWNLYADKLRNLLGKMSDPWDIKDSFTASALFLADLGATAQSAAKEKTAANKYSGGYAGYSRLVMDRAQCIQGFIDTGAMSPDCQDQLGLQ